MRFASAPCLAMGPCFAPALAPPPILPRGCAPAMLEAYDMLPLLNCLDEADVGACLETLNPWLQITQAPPPCQTRRLAREGSGVAGRPCAVGLPHRCGAAQTSP